MSLRKDLSAAQQIKPPGSDKQVLFNSSLAFSTSAEFVFNTSTNQLIGGGGSTAPVGSKTLTWGDTNINNGSFGSALFGETSEINTGVGSALGCGENVYIAGYGGVAFGRGTYAGGTESFIGGRYITSTSGKTNPKAPQTSAIAAFGFYITDTNQTDTHGSNAIAGAILGGRNHNIPSGCDFSAIIGGDAIKARAGEQSQVYVPNLNIVTAPLNDDTLTQVLVRNASTGQIKYRSSTTLGGGGGTWGSITGTLSAQLDLQAALDLKANRYVNKNTQLSNYTLVLSDSDTKIVETNSALSNNVTVPPNTSVAFPIGTQIAVVQYGVGLTSIVAGSGVVIRTSSGVLTSPGQYASMFLIKRATDEWYLLNGVASFSNSAGINELIKSDGTNGAPGKIFVPTNGNLTFGDSSLSGTARSITVDGSGSDIDFNVTTKGAGNINLDSLTGFSRIKAESIILQGGTGGSNGGPYITLAKRTGTFPASAGTNIVLYNQNSSDSTGTVAVYTQQAVEAIGTFTPSHKVKIRWNGVEYWLQLDAV